MRRSRTSISVISALCVACSASSLLYAQQQTQGPQVVAVYAENVPLPSLADAAQSHRAPSSAGQGDYEVPNRMPTQDLRTVVAGVPLARDPLLLPFRPHAPSTMLTQFDGSDNTDNGFNVTPPDTVGDVGPNDYVQMINWVMTIFDKDGAPQAGGPFFPSAIWAGFGGLCESNDNGDPVVLYDEAADRWIVSQFAFGSTSVPPWLECVAVSQTGDPTGAYNRYAFAFDGIGFNDYPHVGISSDAITITANLFNPFFIGTWLGTMDKACMYAGTTTCGHVGFNIGFEVGYLPFDYDDPTGSGGNVPNLFGTALATNGFFDIREIVPDYDTPANTTVALIDQVPISLFDADICSAFREQCIPHSGSGVDLEALSDRLMHRIQVRDMGTHYAAVASHTIDIDAAAAGVNGRAGVRWYELRSTNGGTDWYLHQEGSHGPADGFDRWMGSIAMNPAGDIAIGYMKSSAATAPSIEVAGQVAGSGGNVPLGVPGLLDVAETTCRTGDAGADWSGRAGDYSSMNVDPASGSFWHTNEFGRSVSWRGWGTAVCEFVLPGPGLYVLDDFGGLHTGGGAPTLAPAPPYFGFDIARDFELAAAGGGYVFDGFGGLHATGGAPAMVPAPPFFGFDAGEDIELAATGGYALDAFGGIHNFGGAPAMGGSPYLGFDAARDMELAPTGYYVADGFGAVHVGGGAPALLPAIPYFGFDILKDLELLPTGYLVLEGFGGVHVGGGAPVPTTPTPYFGIDVAADMEMAGPGYYVLDRFGAIHTGNGAKAPGLPIAPYFGFLVARDFEIR